MCTHPAPTTACRYMCTPPPLDCHPAEPLTSTRSLPASCSIHSITKRLLRALFSMSIASRQYSRMRSITSHHSYTHGVPRPLQPRPLHWPTLLRYLGALRPWHPPCSALHCGTPTCCAARPCPRQPRCTQSPGVHTPGVRRAHLHTTMQPHPGPPSHSTHRRPCSGAHLAHRHDLITAPHVPVN